MFERRRKYEFCFVTVCAFSVYEIVIETIEILDTRPLLKSVQNTCVSILKRSSFLFAQIRFHQNQLSFDTDKYYWRVARCWLLVER